MTKAQLVEFIRRHRYAVQASSSPGGAPQAAVVGIAVSDDLEVVFDTLDSTRKLKNLRHDPRISLVIGGDQEQSLQLDGVADEPAGSDLERLKAVYYAAFPDGPSRLAWPGLVYVRTRARWVRWSDFTRSPPEIVEMTF